MADTSWWRSSFGFNDQSVNGATLPTQSSGIAGMRGGAGDIGGIDRAGLGASFDPFGAAIGVGGPQLADDIDFGLDFDAANELDSLGLTDVGDIGFDTNTSSNPNTSLSTNPGAQGGLSALAGTDADAEAEAETEIIKPGSLSGFALSMRNLMANVMKLMQFYSPNIDGTDAIGGGTANDGVGNINYGAGDINYGGSDLSSDALRSRHHPAQFAAGLGAVLGDETAHKNRAGAAGGAAAGYSAARYTAATAAAPGATYVDADPALLAEIAQREQSDPAGAAKLKQLAQQPTTHWLNGTPYDAQHLDEYLNKSQAAGKEASVMFYNIPGRDNGGYSGGGAQNVGEYKAWAKQMSDVIGDRKTTVYLETDAIMQTRDMSPEKVDERLKLIGDTVDMLKKNNPNATVVLNAGSAGWGKPADTAALLKRANVQNADGFFLNVAGFESTTDSMRHGDALVSELDKLGISGKHYIIDTSRNGAKIMATPGTEEAWADPYGAASGTKPTTDQAVIQNPNVMALSWVKTPWNSDGRLSKAGSMVGDYAIKLVENAERLGSW